VPTRSVKKISKALLLEKPETDVSLLLSRKQRYKTERTWDAFINIEQPEARQLTCPIAEGNKPS
jgi:hypothetical protein